MLRISTSRPPASRQWVMSACHVSSLRSASSVSASCAYAFAAASRPAPRGAVSARSSRPSERDQSLPEEAARTVSVPARAAALAGTRLRRPDDRPPPRPQGARSVPSVSTIWRILRREGLVVPQPQKRPRSSLIRFEAELPNEMWQADITHWRAGRRRATWRSSTWSTTTRGCSWPPVPSQRQGRRRGRGLSLCD